VVWTFSGNLGGATSPKKGKGGKNLGKKVWLKPLLVSRAGGGLKVLLKGTLEELPDPPAVGG